MPVKVPAKFIAPPKRFLRDLQIGEQCFVTFTSVELDQDGYAYLEPDTAMEPEKSPLNVTVRRDQQGYHVIVSKKDWFTFPIPARDTSKLYPVESFEEGK